MIQQQTALSRARFMQVDLPTRRKVFQLDFIPIISIQVKRIYVNFKENRLSSSFIVNQDSYSRYQFTYIPYQWPHGISGQARATLTKLRYTRCGLSRLLHICDTTVHPRFLKSIEHCRTVLRESVMILHTYIKQSLTNERFKCNSSLKLLHSFW